MTTKKKRDFGESVSDAAKKKAAGGTDKTEGGTVVLSARVPAPVRSRLNLLAARLTDQRGVRVKSGDLLIEAVADLLEKYK